MDNDRLPLYRENRWLRGLIHFHTHFSDGWGTVRQAAEIAKDNGYDFLIVTDHLRNLKLYTHRSLEDYIAACDHATALVGIPVIPGGEIEAHWERKEVVDQSEAHTLVFCIRDLVEADVFDWTTCGKDPFWKWPDDAGECGTIAAVQKMMATHGLPRVASHQFQHSYLGAKPGAHSDYRYDLQQVPFSDYLDFFYSGSIDVFHEPEDIALVLEYNQPLKTPLKAVYASCDYHVGPEVVLPAIAAFVKSVPFLARGYQWLFETVTSGLLRIIHRDPEQAAFPRFAAEQLGHATYVHLGDRPYNERGILDALSRGRTCVTRGAAEFVYLYPPPDLTHANPFPASFMLDLSRTWRPKYQRPQHVIVLRDGEPVHFRAYDIRSHTLSFLWEDKEVTSGTHLYQLYVPLKFLSSPIVFSDSAS